MLFRLKAHQKLDAINALLDAWNGEADRFRLAAMAARNGEAPSSLVVSAAEEARDGLMHLLDEIDESLISLPAGHESFSALLLAQAGAVALLESVSRSYDTLERFLTEEMAEPKRIAHEFRIAAE
jgi:hypothetical protein